MGTEKIVNWKAANSGSFVLLFDLFASLLFWFLGDKDNYDLMLVMSFVIVLILKIDVSGMKETDGEEDKAAGLQHDHVKGQSRAPLEEKLVGP